MDVKELFESAAKWASTKVKAVTADQLGNDTPCTEWTVKDVANHMTSGVDMVGRAARGDEPDPDALTADYVGDDPAAAHAAAVSSTVGALKGAATDGTWKLPFGEMPAQMAISIFAVDQIVHGWDVAKSTGQDTTIPSELVTAAHGVVGGNIGDDGRGPGKFFGHEVKVADDASEQDKLLGYLGRQP